eukprot:TRINITY_DN8150_c0_g1_i2.p1 TRINITY_DN8150_c0_g1~~TRINITY_DN8150_c0_g1_i2.p1  ORF type:complete len:152 (+),score=26.48 TRINITY_DN8150_c0_g1_i2:57-458(+)
MCIRDRGFCTYTCLYLAQILIEVIVPLHKTVRFLGSGIENPRLWICYWLFYSLILTVWSSFSFLRHFLVYLFRAILCLWMYHEDYQGALFLYDGLLHRQIKSITPMIEPYYARIMGVFDAIGGKTKEVAAKTK